MFGVLRAPRKGRGGGWVYVGGMFTLVTAMLQCDGHHSRVSVPCLEVQSQSGREIGIAERERKGDMTQGHMDRSGGGGATRLALLCVNCFFLSSRIGCDLHDRRRLRTCDKGKGKKENQRQSN